MMPLLLVLRVLMQCSVISAYDIALTFSREVEYVWRRKHSAVTVLFAVNRYSTLGRTILEIITSMYVPSSILVSRNVYYDGQCGEVITDFYRRGRLLVK